MIGVTGSAGHAFPAFALVRALRARGHAVLVESASRWRAVVESTGASFEAAPEQMVFPGPAGPGDGTPGFDEVARHSARLVRAFEPDVVVADLFGFAPAIAAELEGASRATLIPHTWAAYGPGRPPWSSGLALPRTPLGSLMWRAWSLVESVPRRRGQRALNRARASVGLPPQRERLIALSDELVLVATFPQLELPRPRPPHVHVTGPMLFELPHREVDLPPGEDPLVLVAASTGQDADRALVQAALAGLGEEPVRVLATINEPGARWSGPVPDNAVVADWVSYARVMPRAAAVITRGGHGTVVRALAEGIPLLVCPAGGDMGENGGRVASSGTGLMLPGRLLRPRPLRWAVRRLLADDGFSARAREVAEWGRRHDGAERGATLLEETFG